MSLGVLYRVTQIGALSTGAYFGGKAAVEINDKRIEQAQIMQKRRDEVRQETEDLTKLLLENAVIKEPARADSIIAPPAPPAPEVAPAQK